MQRFLARVVLSAALLAAWQIALVHPLVHLDEHGGLVHLGHEHQNKSDPSDLCDALAALTVLACDAPGTPLAVQTVEALPSYLAATRLAAEAPPFLSQGPPQRL